MRVAITCLLFATICPVAPAQQFEVASIKPTVPGTRSAPTLELTPGGRLIATNASLRLLLKKAFGIRDFQIAGAPDWIDSARYDLAAKTEGGRTVDEEQLRALLQAMLAERFKLTSHVEMREMPVYALSIARNGSKLREAKDEAERGAGVRVAGIGRLTGVAASTKQLAEGLSDMRMNGSAAVDRPVLDETGLGGLYDFSLTWAPAASDVAESSIFTALQEQLGLRLESRKAPVPILVIERVEKPSEN